MSYQDEYRSALRFLKASGHILSYTDSCVHFRDFGEVTCSGCVHILIHQCMKDAAAKCVQEDLHTLQDAIVDLLGVTCELLGKSC